jgi:murein DD-endopeptidase MepM/ murein hydrolase activator NlpD
MWKSVRYAALTFVISCLVGTSSMSAAAVTPKQPDLLVSPSRTYPGDVVFVRSKQVQSVTLFNQTYKLQPVAGEYVRFIPVPIGVKPAVYTIQSADKTKKAQFTIAPKKFAVDSITVSKEMNNMWQNTARIAADQKKINQARSQSAKIAYFTDKFQMPAVGRLTTPYGYQRVVNGKPQSRHLAIDIANKQGTPVVASNNGKVVLAESLYLTGNTIIIDHGLNLFSSYGHLSKIEVKPGQMVKKGQIIGRVGSTGFSTGPHLHYAMLIGNTFINPNPFFQASPFLWK